MKKIFNNRNEPNEVINTANYTIGQNYSHFIGKTFQLEKHVVCVDDVIAEGGFSIVFLVKSNQNGKKYALKRMYVNNDADLDVCKREIKIIKSLSEQNKNILKYIDSSIQRQTEEIYEILLLTKYCKLGGLVQLINDRLSSNPSSAHLQENEVIKMFCDVCEGLAELHENGIIHRDLKIENILIDNSEPDKKRAAPNPNSINYVLCDFGSATKKIFDRRLTNSAQQVQLVADEIQKYTTLSYRSPEMVDLYSNKLITTKSDIWALGCLLYKICYFQMPFGESQLAIQEGRYTIPDSKSTYFSKNLNSLINYMLEPDPSKRPDIFQVSYLAFKLAQRPCPIKNTENSPIPSFENLTAPMTESEWRNWNQQNQLKKQQNNLNSISTETTTTVNPRERPKGNLNKIIPLTGSNSVQNTPSKLNMPIKPVIVQQVPQIGFDDDFSSITPTDTHQINQGIPNMQQNQSIITTSTSSDFPQDQTCNSFQQKKSHRRSASHSSSIFQPNTPIATPQINPILPCESRSTPTQQQQYQYQMHLQKQQLELARQQQQQNLKNQNTPQISHFVNNRLLVANHSRSASASPNVAMKAIISTPVAAAHANPVQKGFNQVPTINENQKNSSNVLNYMQNNLQQNPFKQSEDQNENANKNNNPFGDNFSMLNDNDIFGLEFDRIRHSNEKNTNNDLYNQDNLLQLNQANNLSQTGAFNNQFKPEKSKRNKEQRKSSKKLADSSRSSSSSSELHHRNLSNSSQTSSSQSSTYNRSASSSYFDSTEKKYSSASTIISVDSSVLSKKSQANAKSKKKGSKKELKKNSVADPFRQAPFRIQPSIPINISSSNSSNSSLSVTQEASSEIRGPPKNQNETAEVLPVIHSQDQDLQKQPSAFQPYKRHPDPFAGAPFEMSQKRLSPECTTQLQKLQHDRRRSKEKKSNANREVTSLKVQEDDELKNDEIIEVVSKGKQFRTPSNAAKTSSQNPFINAPFTGKKGFKSSAMFAFNLDAAENAPKTSLPTSNFTDASLPTNFKPVIPPKPGTVNRAENADKSEMSDKSKISQQLNVLSLARNLKNEIIEETNDLSNKPKSTLNMSNKIPQSQSLNEIKHYNKLSENSRSGLTTNLIQHFNSQTQETNNSFKNIENKLNTEENPLKQLEPIIDTSKLQFKKKTISAHSTSMYNSNENPTNSKKVSITKSSLTKSHSQNENLTIPQRNLVSINPAPNSSNNSTSGGIANMSFDDY